jgi:hypothetical protein
LYELHWVIGHDNPCWRKEWDDIDAESLKYTVEKLKHLKADDERRGEASIVDTGLFDFKMK